MSIFVCSFLHVVDSDLGIDSTGEWLAQMTICGGVETRCHDLFF